MRRIALESGDFILLEDGVSFLLLEEDWDNEPGSGASGWAPASNASGASWTEVTGGSNTWTEEDGS